MRTTQLTFSGLKIPTKRAFGGALLKKSHAKTARVIATKAPIHLVMRSSLATGEKSFLFRARRIEAVIQKQAARFGVRLYDFANSGNHLHLLVLATNRRAFKNF